MKNEENKDKAYSALISSAIEELRSFVTNNQFPIVFEHENASAIQCALDAQNEEINNLRLENDLALKSQEEMIEMMVCKSNNFKEMVQKLIDKGIFDDLESKMLIINDKIKELHGYVSKLSKNKKDNVTERSNDDIKKINELNQKNRNYETLIEKFKNENESLRENNKDIDVMKQELKNCQK